MKWFGIELCASYSYTNKAGEGERAIVKGDFDAQRFQQSLDVFIEKYVCCPNPDCRRPEMTIAVRKNLVVGRCLVCPWKGGLDSNHKLGSFILKNPPDESGHEILLAIGGDAKSKPENRRRQIRRGDEIVSASLD